ncbi:MAG TPA: SRPBCC family protein [Steroidobacteraceae bacterium]|nr:SRPBCC family protein [Steroidobacteraceae bacterium]
MVELLRCSRLSGRAAVLAGLIGMLGCTSASAFEVQRAEAVFVDEEYRFEMTALLDASVDAVEPVLRDYEGYKALDPRILEARVIERDPAQHIATLETTLRACVGPVCRNVKRIERVEESPGGLIATTDAARSDMKLGETRMTLEKTEDGRTRVIYRTRLKPDFWIPALVARRIMLETLEDATIDLFRNVEKRAQHNVPPPKS